MARAIGLRRHRRLYVRFRELVRERRLEEAIDVGQVLLSRLPDDTTIRRSLANCHARLGDDERAAALLLDGMAPALLDALEGPIEIANLRIAGGSTGEARWRLMPKGVSNVCVIDHRLRDHDGLEYVTKVIRGTRQHKEVRFFESVHAWAPDVAEVAPRLLLCQEVPRSGLVLVTIEKVIGRLPDVEDLREVVRTHGIVTRAVPPEAFVPGAKHQAANDAMKREVSWHARRKTLLPETLASVHAARVNERLMTRLSWRASRGSWPQPVAEILDRLEQAVLGGELYRWVVPDRDHAFLHGDFQKANLLVDDRDGRLRVLDWESYRSGPAAVDLVRYLGTTHSFSAIDAAVPAPGVGSDAGSTIRYLLFVYGLLVSWFETMSVHEMVAKHDAYLSPAVARLDGLMADLSRGRSVA